ncbi:sulfatase domain-containing protein [Pochonia chlamydosporia 170]|uniref:Sulfatase domain-containing protein n=1 Tax=Pochonia chlamydosporia 170 TaxID=1380566 RepID=A0A179F0M5_METCM|nr:sulfatase domain-containing protein [Pochonia chlamydosporia 170]OAQ59017.1 sulfatase domain-containing protein [Pochonia chlamydosporia 170]
MPAFIWILLSSLASQIASCRCALACPGFPLNIFSQVVNPSFSFSLVTVSILSAKFIHVYAHITALSRVDVYKWGLSFFAQDTALILALRLLLDVSPAPYCAINSLHVLKATISCIFTFAQVQVAIISISFFTVVGSELHWRHVGLAFEPSSWPMLLTGLLTYFITCFAIFLASWILQSTLLGFFGFVVNAIRFAFSFLSSKALSFRYDVMAGPYDHLPQVELDLDEVSDDGRDNGTGDDSCIPQPLSNTLQRFQVIWIGHMVVIFLLAIQMASLIARPAEKSFILMSWTPILFPVIDIVHSAPALPGFRSNHVDGISWVWENRTALKEPPHWDWLPSVSSPLHGFEDWYIPGSSHYRAAEDPLKISNLDDSLLPSLRGKLENVEIRHVFLVKLESTRKDVFPIKKGDQIWRTLADTWDNGTLPKEVQQRLATLTRTSNHITGDYGDGFEHSDTSRRGGINFNNDHTTSTYTLKSITGTLCGLTPLVADFNVEYNHHIYQPCLPHIFRALNALDHSKDPTTPTPEYNTYRWRNSFMMSVTNSFDKQNLLMPKLGYHSEELITKEYLQRDDAKFGKVTLPDINYYGMAETAIEDYIRETFETANQNNERVFLTHLTSTTHHPFNMPDDEPYVPLASGGDLEDLSRYVNAAGFVDRWLGRILEILKDHGASNNTLVVLVGDHGLSLPETGAVTPYYQPNIGNFHVPLILSHPALPPISIDDPVNSVSILPTILDLLIETCSLSVSEGRAAHDLIRNYEGQSLIRPLQTTSQRTGQADWQFTVMNTGGAQVSTQRHQPRLAPGRSSG